MTVFMELSCIYTGAIMNKRSAIVGLMNEARSLLRKQSHGVLATVSLELPGYPFGSLTPYSLDQNASPIILVSDIAQHTKNMKADPKVSLTVLEDSDGEQNKGRLTFVADAVKVEDELVAESYYRNYPAAREYSSAHSFSFYRLELKRARYIAGFGKIFWVDEFSLKNPFWGETEKKIVDHMNSDHQEAMSKYCKNYKKLEVATEDELSMTGIDSEGFDLVLNKAKLRFEFEQAISTAEEARNTLVAMVK